MERRSNEITNASKRLAAAGLAFVAFAGFSEKSQADSTRFASIERIADKEAAKKPLKLAEEIIFSMNNKAEGPYKNLVYSGAILFKEGTFINNAPVAEAEKSKKTIPGTDRVHSGQAILVQLPRIVHYGGRDWAIGYVNSDPNRSMGGHAIKVENMKWFDLNTANYEVFGYPDKANPKKISTPKLLHASMNPDADLKLVDKITTFDSVLPPILGLVTELDGNNSLIQSQLDYIGLRKASSQFKSNPT